MGTTGWVAVGVVGLLGSLFAIFAAALFGIRRATAALERRVREQHPDAHLVDAMANCFGVESLGAAQLRGNGVLALTPTELVFQPLVGRGVVQVPLAAITEVDTARGHLGKTVGRDLLRVRFLGAAGVADAVAWYVPTGVDRWRAAIRSLRP